MRGLIAALMPLCTISVKIGPVASEFKRQKLENCAATRPQFNDCSLFETL